MMSATDMGKALLEKAFIAGSNDDEMVKLVECGADIEMRGFFQMTALMMCANNEYLKTLTAIIKRVVDSGRTDILELCDSNGKTAFFHALGQDNKSSEVMTAALIAAGTNVRAVDESGNTLLQWAAWNGHAGASVLLLNAGVDTEAAGKSGTAVDYARGRGHVALAQTIADFVKVQRDQREKDTRTLRRGVPVGTSVAPEKPIGGTIKRGNNGGLKI